MNKCSYFIKNRAIFGCFPIQKSVDELEEHGVRYFIDLTRSDETKIVPYKTKYKYIHYPIKDRSIPIDWKTFAKFIIEMSNIIFALEDGQKIYIHCRGGHGRSGVVVACLLIHMFNISPSEALDKTTKCHSKRHEMRDKWRELGSPQTKCQKNFVTKFFDPLFFYRACKSGHTAGFSNFSPHRVTMEHVGDFPTAEAALQAYKALDNNDYIKKQLHSRTPSVSKNMGSKIILSAEWYSNRKDIMKNIIENKFDQNDEIRNNLTQTGLRPIIEQKGSHEFDNNMVGKILYEYRNKIYFNK
jgi:ribA/ribD-fused uncharacterized protein